MEYIRYNRKDKNNFEIYLKIMTPFEADAPGREQWNSGHLQSPDLVVRAQGAVLGWIALNAVTKRCIYSGVAEISLYVSAVYRGQNVGSALLAALAPILFLNT